MTKHRRWMKIPWFGKTLNTRNKSIFGVSLLLLVVFISYQNCVGGKAFLAVLTTHQEASAYDVDVVGDDPCRTQCWSQGFTYCTVFPPNPVSCSNAPVGGTVSDPGGGSSGGGGGGSPTSYRLIAPGTSLSGITCPSTAIKCEIAITGGQAKLLVVSPGNLPPPSLGNVRSLEQMKNYISWVKQQMKDTQLGSLFVDNLMQLAGISPFVNWNTSSRSDKLMAAATLLTSFVNPSKVFANGAPSYATRVAQEVGDAEVWAYHGTYASNIPSILDKGLMSGYKAGVSSQTRVYFGIGDIRFGSEADIVYIKIPVSELEKMGYGESIGAGGLNMTGTATISPEVILKYNPSLGGR